MQGRKEGRRADFQPGCDMHHRVRTNGDIIAFITLFRSQLDVRGSNAFSNCARSLDRSSIDELGYYGEFSLLAPATLSQIPRYSYSE